ncbi:XRRA1 isoform 17, partial [Pongo abelii]
RGSPQKEPQFILQSKPRMLEDSDEQLDYTVLPMKKDVDRTDRKRGCCPASSSLPISLRVRLS